MTTSARYWQVIKEGDAARAMRSRADRDATIPRAPFDIAPNDPILAYFQSSPEPVDIEQLHLESPALDAMRQAGVHLVVPLVSQGEVIGLLNLGPRLSEQDYSADDRRLLENLASHAAPALRLAQLVREQEAEVRARERLEQELRVAQLIQQHFLPKESPHLPGWHVAAFYRPARAVGGDFYDFIDLPEGRLGIVIGDVTDKGVPAALVMASTRSVLRASAQRLVEPGAVLARVNDHLCGDIPPNMFVTCLYGVLDPASGRLRFANAGHPLPYVRSGRQVVELRARGMPLGLMTGMAYEEREAVLAPGECMLLTSDGVSEAHGARREMFGLRRVMDLVRGSEGGQTLIDAVLGALDQFTGPASEQEDDITLVTVERSASFQPAVEPIASFRLPSEPGREREAMERVAEAVRTIDLPHDRLERLKTAVAEATMNAIEHGNANDASKPVLIDVLGDDVELVVRITDHGGGSAIPETTAPDLEAKLAGTQAPRGWGLFLIKNMVDELRVTSDEGHHTVELVVRRKGSDRP